MRRALASLPRDQVTAYEEVMTRIGRAGRNTRSTVFRTLSWVLHAVVPLSASQLCEALVIERGDLYLNFADLTDLPIPAIIKSCESLILVDRSQLVRFTHHTVQEFLQANVYERLPTPVYIAETCITCLTFDVHSGTFSQKKVDVCTSLEFEIGNEKSGELDEALHDPLPGLENAMAEDRTWSSAFQCYADSYWDTHTRGDAEEIPEIHNALFAFLERDSVKANRMIEKRWSHLPISLKSNIPRLNVLHILAATGLEKLFQLYLDERLQGRKYSLDLSLRLMHQNNSRRKCTSR